MRYIWLLPVLFKVQKMLVYRPFRVFEEVVETNRSNECKPFEFEDGYKPNLYDSSTYEDMVDVNLTKLFESIEEWLEIKNDTNWEEVVIDSKTTNWEDMMRFGIGEA